MKTKYLPYIVAAGFALSLAVTLPVFAQTQASGNGAGGYGGHFGFGPGPAMIPGIVGTVTAVDGTTLTVTSRMRPRGLPTAAPTPTATAAAATVYTVDASNAKVMKNGTSSTVSDISTGDMVMVQGTVTGDNVTATVIRDGVMPMMMGRRGFRFSSSTLPIQGNGEPVIAGSIASISGTTLTVTNASNITYTVDATSATIVKNGTSTTFSNVATGDRVIIQGTVNGTSVTASSIIDQGAAATATGSSGSAGVRGGFFGAIGSFFKRLFGF